VFKENHASHRATLIRGLPPNIFNTIQNINALASIDCASYKSSRQTFNLTFLSSENSFPFSAAVSEDIFTATTTATAITISASVATALNMPRVAVWVPHAQQ